MRRKVRSLFRGPRLARGICLLLTSAAEPVSSCSALAPTTGSGFGAWCKIGR